jgi:hypothetical protein
MRLSGEILQEIIGRPAREFIGRGGHRALGRLAVQAPAMIFPVYDGVMDDSFKGAVRDISAETIGLSSARAMMPSAELVVCLTLTGGQPLAIQCQVARCSSLLGGGFVIAARFVRLLDAQALNLTSLNPG